MSNESATLTLQRRSGRISLKLTETSIFEEGQDFGGLLGSGEYEWGLSVGEEEAVKLWEALGVTDVENTWTPERAVERMAASGALTRGMKTWLDGQGVVSEFWSRLEFD